MMGDTLEITELNALAIIPAAQLPTILAADDKDILKTLLNELEGWEPDISTERGRKEIASKAQKVRVAKADFGRLADRLKEDAIKTQRAVNAEFKILETRLNELVARVRSPLDEYEAAEAARVKANHDAIAALGALTDGLTDLSSDEIAIRQSAIPTFDWSIEFRARGEKARSGAIAQLRVAFQDALQREAEKEAEVARQATEAERQRLAEIEERRLREEQIARQAAETARMTAEAEAARQAREAEEKAQAALQAAEAEAARQAREAEEKAQAALQAAEALRKRQAEVADEALRRAEQKHQADLDEAERLRKAQEAHAAQARLDAERAAKAAEERAEQRRIAAIETERQRVAQEAAAKKADDDRRAADKAHRAAINRDVLVDLMQAIRAEVLGERAEAIARLAVIALAKSEVRHVTINY